MDISLDDLTWPENGSLKPLGAVISGDDGPIAYVPFTEAPESPPSADHTQPAPTAAPGSK
jgi:hypothetical protein